MKPRTQKEDEKAKARARDFLVPLGWNHIGGWNYIKNGVLYDLSAADITQHEKIEKEGLFTV